MKILFVCTGNTCRSPMAAALMNKITTDNDMDVVSDSAGIFAEQTSTANEKAVKTMKDYNINIENHKAKQLTEALINDFDIILTMTEGQKTMISALAPEKVFTICEYAGYEGEISDPYGGTLTHYQQTASDIYDCLTDIAEKIYDLTGN